jgi:hypothetical protein
MDKDKEKQEISVIGRLLSLEALLVVMGLFSLISGVAGTWTLRILLGLIILGGLFMLLFIRRRSMNK